mmetsp:Transcript_36409/g.86458  ORF Transcript_36409/g.86458 Transcript_36409/m.86458 type:complete len:237 (+) Transcript_36409:301-1011(+)
MAASSIRASSVLIPSGRSGRPASRPGLPTPAAVGMSRCPKSLAVPSNSISGPEDARAGAHSWGGPVESSSPSSSSSSSWNSSSACPLPGPRHPLRPPRAQGPPPRRPLRPAPPHRRPRPPASSPSSLPSCVGSWSFRHSPSPSPGPAPRAPHSCLGGELRELTALPPRDPPPGGAAGSEPSSGSWPPPWQLAALAGGFPRANGQSPRCGWRSPIGVSMSPRYPWSAQGRQAAETTG